MIPGFEKVNEQLDALTVRGDLISRQAAIDAMSVINDSICEQQAINALYDLPSAQPERKRGKWIMHPSGKFVGFPYVHYECDQCRDFEPEERNYCPNCGAEMKGEDE